jgi:hypothetical protein
MVCHDDYSNIEEVNDLFAGLTRDELEDISTDPWKQYHFLFDPEAQEWIALNPDGMPVGVSEVVIKSKPHIFVKSLGNDITEALHGCQHLVRRLAFSE